MSVPVVLDAEGLAGLAAHPPPSRLRLVLDEAFRQRREVLVPALVCAEVCRGVDRTREVEAALSRSGRRSASMPVAVVDTDFELARQVGAILHAAGSAVEDIVDAHVVAVCVRHGAGVVVTSDPDDIQRLAAVVPSTRIVALPAR